jgi:maleate isomerase
MIFGWRARIGQIRPASAIEGAEEWRRVAPEGVAFIDARTIVQEVSEKGLQAMMAQVVEAARQVASARPDLIVQCGAPGIFLQGFGQDKVVIDEIFKATNVPATTMMTSMVDAMHALGMRRVAVGTIYTDQVNAKLKTYLEKSGFEVVSMKGLQIVAPADVIYLEASQAYRLGREVASKDSADGILISCGGFRTFEMIDSLEKDTGMPVVTSNQASLWKALRMVRIADHIAGLGRLFNETVAAP